MKIKKIPIKEINPAKYNPRVDLTPGDPDYERIKRSLDSFGAVEPLVWNEHNKVLVSGHQRLKIMKANGAKTVDVSVVSIKDSKKEKALNLALNNVSGRNDDEKLASILEELGELDDKSILESAGFSEEDVEKILKSVETEPPEGFKNVEINTTHTCPKCGFKF